MTTTFSHEGIHHYFHSGAACVLAAASPAAESQALAKAPAQAAAGIPKQDPQLIKGQLPNGLTYFIRPNAEPKGVSAYACASIPAP